MGTLLPDGRVLIAGGRTGTSAELYDAITGSFTATGRMETMRANNTATLLPNGTVLLAGGESYWGTNSSQRTAGIYDPSTGTFSATTSMAAPRTSAAATLLQNGKVIIVGGYEDTIMPPDFADVHETAELYE